MKAISLHQPWATLLVIGAKKYETRSFRTHQRGPILIHSAKKLTDLGIRKMATPAVQRALEEAGLSTDYVYPRGSIIGSVHLVGCHHTHIAIEEVDPIEFEFGNFVSGRFAWETSSPVRFDTVIPYRGKQGFFTVPDELIKACVTSICTA